MWRDLRRVPQWLVGAALAVWSQRFRTVVPDAWQVAHRTRYPATLTFPLPEHALQRRTKLRGWGQLQSLVCSSRIMALLPSLSAQMPSQLLARWSKRSFVSSLLRTGCLGCASWTFTYMVSFVLRPVTFPR